MSKLTHQVTINAPVDKVWGVLADFGAIDKWAPPVSKSYSKTEAKGGGGAGGTATPVSAPSRSRSWSGRRAAASPSTARPSSR